MSSKKESSKSSATDCSPIKGEYRKKFFEYNKYFVEQINSSVISFSKNSEKRANSKDENQFVSFGKDGTLWAGRWVGYDKKERIEVTPRFGYNVIAFMLSEAFSFNVKDSIGGIEKDNGTNIMKALIPYIWNQKLSSANKYGVPRKTVNIEHFGYSIKGRVEAKKSIIPMHLSNKVFSISREKQVDSSIAQIICTAYSILKKNYSSTPKLSKNSETILNAFKTIPKAKASSLNKVYKSIRYKSIYLSYKDIVDFSWQIINNRGINSGSDEEKNSYALFVDMAEIWEIYLRSLLRKSFPKWNVLLPEETICEVYKDAFWKRRIIPDIVLEQGNKIIIFDAKWKRMEGKPGPVNQSDLDRSDFFQIHSYIDYFKSHGKDVVAGGLLYPLSGSYNTGATNCYHLWGENKEKIKFLVDGIYLKENGNFKESQEAFINRLKPLLDE